MEAQILSRPRQVFSKQRPHIIFGLAPIVTQVPHKSVQFGISRTCTLRLFIIKLNRRQVRSYVPIFQMFISFAGLLISGDVCGSFFVVAIKGVICLSYCAGRALLCRELPEMPGLHAFLEAGYYHGGSATHQKANALNFSLGHTPS